MCEAPCGSRLSSPTCEELGIPYSDFSGGADSECDVTLSPPSCLQAQQPKHSAVMVHGLTYDIRNPNNPFSPYCRIPLPSPLGLYEYGLEPAFIRKRNERERERVRCVNDGYAKLREHLPQDKQDGTKRISKVETLKCAISYIETLQNMLDQLDNTGDMTDPVGKCRKRCKGLTETVDASTNDAMWERSAQKRRRSNKEGGCNNSNRY